MDVKKTRALGRGACFGVIALSSPARRDSLADGLSALQAAGYRSRVALDPAAEYDSGKFLFSSADKRDRVAALHEFFADPDIDAVISVRGAYGSLELLPLIDFSLLARHPKPLLGISDTTVLLTAAYAYAGVPAVHAQALAGGISEVNRSPEASRSFAALRELLSAGRYESPLAPLSAFNGGIPGEGRLLGGNLTMLCSLLGTPWEPDFSGHIIFLEEVGESPYRVHRSLMQLKLAGKFENVRGVVFGSLRDCCHKQGLGPSVEEVIRDIFRESPFLVAGGAPFGHQPYNLPVPLGVRARLTPGRLELLESFILA